MKLNYYQRTILAPVKLGHPVELKKETPAGIFVHVIDSAQRHVYLLPHADGPAKFVRSL